MNLTQTYILDTSVLLFDPDSLYHFSQSQLIIPIGIIEELSQFKNVSNETGSNARKVLHILDELRNNGSLTKGITLKNESILKIDDTPLNAELLPSQLELNKSSNRILASALHLQKKHQSILITQDPNVRVKANVLGIPVLPYDGEPSLFSLHTGITKHTLSSEEIAIYQKKEQFTFAGEYYPNEGLLLEDENDVQNTVLARFIENTQTFIHVPKELSSWGIVPRNPEQRLAMDLLLDPAISIVSLVGKAGTGKTLLALTVGLQMMLAENQYKRVLVSRPVIPMGRNIGYLPGGLQEKLSPWMQPIFDNLELLIDSLPEQRSHSNATAGYQELIENGLLVIEPLTYIRGRSIPNQYLIVDESQNLTPHEIKTIITRAGEGTKIILTGDPFQIDNPYVSTSSNGMSYVIERLKKHAIAGHVNLTKGERSPLAELAANLL